jgi:hypothetical protein
MATIEHPRTSPPALLSAPRPKLAVETPPPAVADPPAWVDAPEVAPPDDAEPGATSTVLMTLGCGVWPFVVILAGLALIVPFLAGLVVVGLAGALLLPPYWLIHRWHNGR